MIDYLLNISQNSLQPIIPEVVIVMLWIMRY